MSSCSKRSETRRKAKRTTAGLKRKKLLNREGSTKSAKDLFATKS